MSEGNGHRGETRISPPVANARHQGHVLYAQAAECVAKILCLECITLQATSHRGHVAGHLSLSHLYTHTLGVGGVSYFE